ncbi:MAG: TolC family protein, partial [Pseudomonadota bacterium]
VRRSQLNRTKAEILELDWGFEQIELDVSRRIKQAYNQITANRITLDATNDEILFNTELQTLNAKNLELGEVSIIELIEVEERLFNAKVRAFGIRADMLANYYRLMIGVGTLPFTNANSYRDRDPFEIQKRGESLALP